MDMRHGRDQRCGGQHPHAGNLLQTGRDGVRACHMRELPIDRGDAYFKRANFVDDERHGVAEQIREDLLGILKDARDTREHRAGAEGSDNPCSRSNARDVDPRSAGHLPLRAHAMERLKGLLLDGLHRHGLHAPAPRGFQ